MEGPVRYELSDLDRQAPDTIVKCFTFCKLQETLELDKLKEALQQGLDSAIEHLPFMAGNICVDQSGKPYIESVPGTRVELHVKHYTSKQHKSFTDLARNCFHPDDLDLAMLLPELPVDHIPACGLQLNVIEGGLILASSAHHFAVDFTSMRIFLGAVYMGSKAYYYGYPLLNFAISLDRRPFNGQSVPESVSKQELLDLCPEYRVLDLKGTLNCRSNAVDLAEYQMKIYKISEEEIAELKEQCYLPEGVKYVTSFDCISAALWKSVTRARVSTTVEKLAYSSLVFTIDLRSRDPEHVTSTCYFGNAVALIQAGPLDAQSLLGGEGISIAASSIRQKINGVTISSIKDLTQLIRCLPPNEKLKYDAEFKDTDFLVNSWFSEKVEDFDFGAGVPEALRPKPNPLIGAFCVFLPCFDNPSKRTYELLIQLRPKEHEMLKEDPFFFQVFQACFLPCTVKIKGHTSLSSSSVTEVELLGYLGGVFTEEYIYSKDFYFSQFSYISGCLPSISNLTHYLLYI